MYIWVNCRNSKEFTNSEIRLILKIYITLIKYYSSEVAVTS